MKMVLIVLSVILACFLLPAAVIMINSGNNPKPVTDDSGKPLKNSISEKTFIEINGSRQGMFIKSTDVSNPVLLYLHGGMPDYFLDEKYPTGLEKIFTVVWWEQRGSGMSFDKNVIPGSITSDQMASDVLEMTRYLINRFGKEKIYLMGHSGGTFIGIKAAARAPELYHAYIGVAQMADQLASERLAYKYMVDTYGKAGNEKMLKKLQAAQVTDKTPAEYLKIRDIAMHDLGVGTMHNMRSVVTGIFLPSLMCSDYTFTEKINTWYGKSRSGVSMLWNEVLSTDLSREVTEIGIPVYFFEGRHDLTCAYELARSYFSKINAPVKGFYTFEQSAHSPMFEEPGKMQRIIREDVLKGSNMLADPER